MEDRRSACTVLQGALLYHLGQGCVAIYEACQKNFQVCFKMGSVGVLPTLTCFQQFTGGSSLQIYPAFSHWTVEPQYCWTLLQAQAIEEIYMLLESMAASKWMMENCSPLGWIQDQILLRHCTKQSSCPSAVLLTFSTST